MADSRENIIPVPCRLQRAEKEFRDHFELSCSLTAPSSPTPSNVIPVPAIQPSRATEKHIYYANMTRLMEEHFGQMSSEERKGVKAEGTMEKEQEEKRDEEDEKKAAEDNPEYVKMQNDVINSISEAVIHDLYESPLTNKDETICLNDYFWQIHRPGLTAKRGAMGKGLSTKEAEFPPPPPIEINYGSQKRIFKTKGFSN